MEDLLPLACENKTETRATQKGKRKNSHFWNGRFNLLKFTETFISPHNKKFENQFDPILFIFFFLEMFLYLPNAEPPTKNKVKRKRYAFFSNFDYMLK